MNLSPAETTLIDILREKVGAVFTISITKNETGVVVTMAMPDNGVNIGTGASFEGALYDLCGVEPTTDYFINGRHASLQH